VVAAIHIPNRYATGSKLPESSLISQSRTPLEVGKLQLHMLERLDFVPVFVRQSHGVIGILRILRIDRIDMKQPGRLGRSF
jgi:hypothetical protein